MSRRDTGAIEQRLNRSPRLSKGSTGSAKPAASPARVPAPDSDAAPPISEPAPEIEVESDGDDSDDDADSTEDLISAAGSGQNPFINIDTGEYIDIDEALSVMDQCMDRISVERADTLKSFSDQRTAATHKSARDMIDARKLTFIEECDHAVTRLKEEYEQVCKHWKSQARKPPPADPKTASEYTGAVGKDLHTVENIIAMARGLSAEEEAELDGDFQVENADFIQQLREILNGHTAKEVEGVMFSFVKRSNYAMFPTRLISDKWISSTRAEYDAASASRSADGVVPGYEGIVQFLPHRASWRSKSDETHGSLGNRYPMRGTLDDWVAIVALNLSYGRSMKCSMCIATAGLSGCYNWGASDEVLKREWDHTDKTPSMRHYATVMEVIADGAVVSYIQYCYNIIASLYYLRISDTHPVLSDDAIHMEKITKRIQICSEGIADLEDMPTATAEDAKSCFHGPLHGASLHGCAGIHRYWISSIFCQPKVKVRDSPIGDLNKDCGISDGGYPGLVTHPLVRVALSGWSTQYQRMNELIRSYKGRSHLTSSLVYLFEDSEPHVLSAKSPEFVGSLNAAIAAALDHGLVDESFSLARHITGVRRKSPGAVSFWKSYFRGMRRQVMTINAISMKAIMGPAGANQRRAIADAASTRDPAAQADGDDGDPEEGDDDDQIPGR